MKRLRRHTGLSVLSSVGLLTFASPPSHFAVRADHPAIARRFILDDHAYFPVKSRSLGWSRWTEEVAAADRAAVRVLLPARLVGR